MVAKLLLLTAALSRAGTTGFALHGDLLFFARAKKSKQKKARPNIRPGALRRVPSLHRRSRGTLRRAIHGASQLSRHPCRSTPSTAIPLTLLKGRLVLSAGSYKRSKNEKLADDSASVPRQQAEWRCCAGGREAGRRARNEGTGTSLRDGPRSGTGAREVWPQARPGCRGGLLFGYFLLARQEKVTRRARRNLSVGPRKAWRGTARGEPADRK